MLGPRLPLLLVMRALFWELLATAAAAAAAAAGSSLSLSAPENVTIDSYNFEHILRWSPVKGINGSVSYSVEYVEATSKTGTMICDNITKLECDFTRDSIKSYYNITLRVRAEQGELKSPWAKSKAFKAIEDTVIGPPEAINVRSEANMLIISYLPPIKNEFFSHIDYVINYWEKSGSENETYETRNTLVSLENLKQLTEYCFQIQALLQNGALRGKVSDQQCVKTTASEARKILNVILAAVVAAVGLFAVFLIFRFIQKYQNVIKSFWQPPVTIPSHYEEDLANSQLAIPTEFQNCAGEEQWDLVSVISNLEENQTVTSSMNSQDQQEHASKVEDHR